MIQPLQHLRHAPRFAPGCDHRPLHHHNRQAQQARGVQLGLGAGSAGILGDNDIHLVVAHQRGVCVHVKRATRDDDGVLRQGRWAGRRIDQPQDVMVLRLGCKFCKVHAAQCQHDGLRRPLQCRRRGADVGYRMPAVAGDRMPGRTGQRQQGYTRLGSGGDGIAAHLSGKRMGGIDQVGDGMRVQIPHQPRHAAKAADAHGDGLRSGLRHTPRIRQNRMFTPFGQGMGQRAGFKGASEDKDVAHG